MLLQMEARHNNSRKNDLFPRLQVFPSYESNLVGTIETFGWNIALRILWSDEWIIVLVDPWWI